MALTKNGQSFISRKIAKIKREGVRGHEVPQKQAVAIAFAEARRRGYRTKNKNA